MARLNIEDEFFDDIAAVAARLGDLDRAIGQALRLIRWGQQMAKANKPMTYEEFQRKGFSDDLMPEFATHDGDCVAVRGAAKHFSWLQKRAAAGAKGGRSKTEAKTSTLKQNRSKPKQTERGRSKTEASYSYSSSFSGSNSDSSSFLNTLPVVADQPAVENPVKVYCDAYKANYKHSPPIAPKQAGILTKFAKDHPGKWQDIIRGYLSMPDTWATQRSHPVELLPGKVNEIVRYLETGKVVTRKVVQHAEEAIDRAQGTDKRPRRSVADSLLDHEKQKLISIDGGKDGDNT